MSDILRMNRRTMISGSAAFAVMGMLASVPASASQETVLEGYVQPFGLGENKYLLSAEPFHCLDCYGLRPDLVVFELEKPLRHVSGKLRVAGVLRKNPLKSNAFANVLEKASILKNASPKAFL